MLKQEQLIRWRLILGKDSQESMAQMSASGCALSAEQLEMDEAIEAIYASDSEQEISRSEKVSTQEASPDEDKEEGRIKSEADTEDQPAPERSSVLGERLKIRLGRTVWRSAKFVANPARGLGERRRTCRRGASFRG